MSVCFGPPGFQQMTWKVRCFGWNFVDFGSGFRVQVFGCLATQETEDNVKDPSAFVSVCVCDTFQWTNIGPLYSTLQT